MPERIVIAKGHDAELTVAAFALRLEVFVIEQRVPLEMEIDEHDSEATHFLVFDGDTVIATARIVDCDGVAKIGRVAVKAARRKHGVGRRLMHRVIEQARAEGYRQAILDAQVDVMAFYRDLGFREEGDVFDDAGIPHMRMARAI